MATKEQVTLANSLLGIIQREGRINKFDLMDKASIGISTYNQISAWFKHRYQDTVHAVEYESKTKSWIWKGTNESKEKLNP